MVIEPYEDSKLDAIVRLSLRAWEPVFESLKTAMLPNVYRAFYADDWRAAQRRAVESVCADENVPVWVALEETRTVGFVALKLHPEDRMGEVYMIAVDPGAPTKPPDFAFSRSRGISNHCELARVNDSTNLPGVPRSPSGPARR